MKLKFLKYIVKYISVLSIACSFVGMASANANNVKTDRFYLAPFSHIEIKAASKIYVNYKLGFDEQLICQSEEDNDAITSVEWTYKNATRKIDLPVILKDNAESQGYYADPEGLLAVTNEFGSSTNDGSIFVSCTYHKIQ